jgi:hypothetical protein
VGVNIFGETETMLISEAIEDNERALRCHTLKRVVLSMFLVGVINFECKINVFFLYGSNRVVFDPILAW